VTAAYGSVSATPALTFTSGAACTPTIPPSTVAGDLLIAWVFYGADVTTPDTPTGWTLLDGPRSLNTPATNGRVWVYGKKAVGGDAAPAFGTQAVTTPRRAIVYRFTGVLDDTVANMVGGFGFDGPASNATINDVGVTTGADSTDYLAVNLVAVADDNAVADFTGETGGNWTEAVAQFTGTLGTPDTCLQIQTAVVAPSTTINGGSQTMAAADPWGVVGFYIRSEPPPNLELVQELDGQSVSGQITLTATLAAVDDLIVLIQADNFYTLANLITPTGTAVTTWTEQTANGLPVDGGTNDNHAKVWTGTVTTAGGTVIANRTNTDDEGYAAAFVLRGAAGTPEFDTGDATESDANATAHVAPSVTPTSGRTDDFLLCVWGTPDTLTNYTLPGGMTAHTEQDVNGINTYRAGSEQLTTDSATGSRSATSSANTTWFAVSVLVKTTGGGQTVNAGQVVETETSRPVTLLKTETAGQVIETETSRPVTLRVTKLVGQVTETETSQAVTTRKTVVLGQVVETELAQPVSLGGAQNVPIGQVVEIETARPVTLRRTKSIGQIIETETARPVAFKWVVNLGQVVELESVLALTVDGGAPVFTVGAARASVSLVATGKSTAGVGGKASVSPAASGAHSEDGG